MAPSSILDSRGSPKGWSFRNERPGRLAWAFFWLSDVTGGQRVWMCALSRPGCGRMARHEEGPGVESRPSSDSDVLLFRQMRGCRPICIWPDPTGVAGLDRDRSCTAYPVHRSRRRIPLRSRPRRPPPPALLRLRVRLSRPRASALVVQGAVLPAQVRALRGLVGGPRRVSRPPLLRRAGRTGSRACVMRSGPSRNGSGRSRWTRPREPAVTRSSKAPRP